MILNRTYQLKARQASEGYYRPKKRPRFKRPGKNFKPLQGEQLKFDFNAPIRLVCPEGFHEALEMTFPERALTDDELYREFIRLFPE